MTRLLIQHARQIVQVCSNNQHMVCDSALLQNVSVMEGSSDATGLSLVVDEQGKILDMGDDATVREKYKETSFEREIDATGKCIIPGF